MIEKNQNIFYAYPTAPDEAEAAAISGVNPDPSWPREAPRFRRSPRTRSDPSRAASMAGSGPLASAGFFSRCAATASTSSEATARLGGNLIDILDFWRFWGEFLGLVQYGSTGWGWWFGSGLG